MVKVKDKERILKGEKEKQFITYKGNSLTLSADFLQKLTGQKGVVRYINNAERKKLPTKNSLHNKVIIHN